MVAPSYLERCKNARCACCIRPGDVRNPSQLARGPEQAFHFVDDCDCLIVRNPRRLRGYGNVIKFCRTSISFKVRTNPRSRGYEACSSWLHNILPCYLEPPITSRGYGDLVVVVQGAKCGLISLHSS